MQFKWRRRERENFPSLLRRSRAGLGGRVGLRTGRASLLKKGTISFCLNLRPDRTPPAQIKRTSVGSICRELRGWAILHNRRLPTRASSPRACARPLQKDMQKQIERDVPEVL